MKKPEKTCKDCGFYENNCPYIRGKFIPYPSKVCKDYTYSVIKEQEQPCEDLEEAAENYIAPIENKEGLYYINYCGRDIKDAFIAGAEWQKEQMISALKNDGELPIEFIDKFHEIDRNAFQNGQKNVKAQMPMPEDTVIFQKGIEEGKRLMMEEAVEGFIFQSADYYPKQLIAGYDGELGMGDKVKIVIVKEEKV